MASAGIPPSAPQGSVVDTAVSNALTHDSVSRSSASQASEQDGNSQGSGRHPSPRAARSQVSTAVSFEGARAAGSAIQPSWSVDEDSALSAAEGDAAGPSRSVQATAARRANSLISTAVQNSSRREQHASSLKVAHPTNSVVSQNAQPNKGAKHLPRGGTPASVHSNLAAPLFPARGHRGDRASRPPYDGAGPSHVPGAFGNPLPQQPRLPVPPWALAMANVSTAAHEQAAAPRSQLSSGKVASLPHLTSLAQGLPSGSGAQQAFPYLPLQPLHVLQQALAQAAAAAHFGQTTQAPPELPPAQTAQDIHPFAAASVPAPAHIAAAAPGLPTAAAAAAAAAATDTDGQEQAQGSIGLPQLSNQALDQPPIAAASSFAQQSQEHGLPVANPHAHNAQQPADSHNTGPGMHPFYLNLLPFDLAASVSYNPHHIPQPTGSGLGQTLGQQVSMFGNAASASGIHANGPAASGAGGQGAANAGGHAGPAGSVHQQQNNEQGDTGSQHESAQGPQFHGHGLLNTAAAQSQPLGPSFDSLAGHQLDTVSHAGHGQVADQAQAAGQQTYVQLAHSMPLLMPPLHASTIPPSSVPPPAPYTQEQLQAALRLILHATSTGYNGQTPINLVELNGLFPIQSLAGPPPVTPAQPNTSHALPVAHHPGSHTLNTPITATAHQLHKPGHHAQAANSAAGGHKAAAELQDVVSPVEAFPEQQPAGASNQLRLLHHQPQGSAAEVQGPEHGVHNPTPRHHPYGQQGHQATDQLSTGVASAAVRHRRAVRPPVLPAAGQGHAESFVTTRQQQHPHPYPDASNMLQALGSGTGVHATTLLGVQDPRQQPQVHAQIAGEGNMQQSQHAGEGEDTALQADNASALEGQRQQRMRDNPTGQQSHEQMHGAASVQATVVQEETMSENNSPAPLQLTASHHYSHGHKLHPGPGPEAADVPGGEVVSQLCNGSRSTGETAQEPSVHENTPQPLVLPHQFAAAIEPHDNQRDSSLGMAAGTIDDGLADSQMANASESSDTSMDEQANRSLEVGDADVNSAHPVVALGGNRAHVEQPGHRHSHAVHLQSPNTDSYNPFQAPQYAASGGGEAGDIQTATRQTGRRSLAGPQDVAGEATAASSGHPQGRTFRRHPAALRSPPAEQSHPHYATLPNPSLSGYGQQQSHNPAPEQTRTQEGSADSRPPHGTTYAQQSLGNDPAGSCGGDLQGEHEPLPQMQMAESVFEHNQQDSEHQQLHNEVPQPQLTIVVNPALETPQDSSVSNSARQQRGAQQPGMDDLEQGAENNAEDAAECETAQDAECCSGESAQLRRAHASSYQNSAGRHRDRAHSRSDCERQGIQDERDGMVDVSDKQPGLNAGGGGSNSGISSPGHNQKQSRPGEKRKRGS